MYEVLIPPLKLKILHYYYYYHHHHHRHHHHLHLYQNNFYGSTEMALFYITFFGSKICQLLLWSSSKFRTIKIKIIIMIIIIVIIIIIIITTTTTTTYIFTTIISATAQKRLYFILFFSGSKSISCGRDYIQGVAEVT